MWLLPLVRPFARTAIGLFYRFEVAGERPAATGPLLVVANHPNMAADAGAVIAALPRPVRFLAKAPLFANPVVGAVLRGVGAIPVYRRRDDPGSVERNQETFEAAGDALATGAAVAVFPEGISHGEPALAPLRTGAARIALATAERTGGAFPIVAVGLTYRDKTRFRSRALALVGGAVEWDDLASPPADAKAVRELTKRIDRALRRVTVNLETWEDAPAVEAAEAIYAAALGLPRDAESRATRLRDIARMLERLRETDEAAVEPLERAVVSFDAFLRRLGLRPATLDIATRVSVAVRWVAGRVLPFAIVAPFLLVGLVLFFVPYRLTDLLAARGAGPEVRASLKILGGCAVYIAWFVVLAVAAGIAFGAAAGLGVFVLLPAVGTATLAAAQWWDRTRREAKTFLLLRSRESLRQRLLARRAELASELERLRASFEASRQPGH
ncbi:MAG: 1-acyl-sn-glycerol-3-phosphate acyltransferase [Thermoanaerobaculia bacterium]